MAVVPYGPFYTLIALNLLSVAIGIVIGLLAVRRRNAGNVHFLLNIWGFVAQALEPEPEKVTIVERIEDLFEEFREM